MPTSTMVPSSKSRPTREMPYGTRRKLMRPATAAAGWTAGTWPQDALRHSAISYWLGIEPNRAAVAKWSGTSAAVQTRDYDNPRSPEEAAEWYAVLPPIDYVQPPKKEKRQNNPPDRSAGCGPGTGSTR